MLYVDKDDDDYPDGEQVKYRHKIEVPQNSKQVMVGTQHYCDARTPEAALIIKEALTLWCMVHPHKPLDSSLEYITRQIGWKYVTGQSDRDGEDVDRGSD